MVLKPYDGLYGAIIRETDAAILMSKGTEWHQSGSYAEFGDDIWIPKSVLHDDSKDTIEEAIEGEQIEIYVARWWLEENS
jgi:hypothetical protein